MKVLFLTHTRLGDAVLSTSVVNHYATQFPDARLTVVCSPLVAGLFTPMPNVEKVIAVRKRSFSRHWLDVWKQTVSTRWDVVVDLRNSVVSRLLCAGKRHIWKKQPDTHHKVEQIASVLGVAPPPAPCLWFDRAAHDKIAHFLRDVPQPRIAIAPVANWVGKTWPAERFAALIDLLETSPDRPFEQPSYIIMAGPGEETVAQKVLQACPQGRGYSAIASFSPLEAACLISQCDAFIGNDSGLMHCAAATGAPTLALFGPTNARVYGPWGANTRVVATPQSYDDFISDPDFSPSAPKTLMGALAPETVYMAFRELMAAVRAA